LLYRYVGIADFLSYAYSGQEAQDGPPPPLEIIPDSERLLPVEAKVRDWWEEVGVCMD
jgi:hypothetical protein